MGIYFNDQLVEAKENGNQLEKMYWNGLKEVEELFKKHNGTIVLNRKFRISHDITGQNQRPVPPAALPTEVNTYLDGIGATTIRYSKSPPIRREQGRLEYPTTRIFVYESYMLSEKEKDLAWFVLKATKLVSAKEKEKNFLTIHDPEAEVRQKVKEFKRTSEIDSYLAREDSPFYNREALKMIADRFGIETDFKDVDMAAFFIREQIVNGEKEKSTDVNIDLFLDYAKVLERKFGKNDKTKVPEGKYTRGYLEKLEQKDLNVVAREVGAKCPPQTTRVAQVEEILELQGEVETV